MNTPTQSPLPPQPEHRSLDCSMLPPTTQVALRNAKNRRDRVSVGFTAQMLVDGYYEDKVFIGCTFSGADTLLFMDCLFVDCTFTGDYKDVRFVTCTLLHCTLNAPVFTGGQMLLVRMIHTHGEVSVRRSNWADVHSCPDSEIYLDSDSATERRGVLLRTNIVPLPHVGVEPLTMWDVMPTPNHIPERLEMIRTMARAMAATGGTHLNLR